MTGSQLTFASESRERRGPRPAGPIRRALDRAEARAVADRAASPETGAKYEALKQVREHLLTFIERLGVEATFQSPDFTQYLTDVGGRPDPAVLDLRSIGGIFAKLAAAGVLAVQDHAPSRAVRSDLAHAHSTIRPVYLVRRLPTRKEVGLL